MQTVANLIIALESLAKAKADNAAFIRVRHCQDFVEEKASEVRLSVYSQLIQHEEKRAPWAPRPSEAEAARKAQIAEDNRTGHATYYDDNYWSC
jgi:hypothetical protein